MVPDMNPPPGAAAFLAENGWAGASVVPLAGDASFRRYFRVHAGGRSGILMDCPPPHDDAGRFIAIAGWLAERGFGAPAILASADDARLALLEDFGDARVRETVDAAPESEHRIYAQAVDLLVDLQARQPMDLPVYDRAIYQRETGLMLEWYCAALGLDVDAAGYVAAWDEVLDPVERAKPLVTVLRDYHAENIMLIDGRDDLGLLDFQDALAGHPAYDLVSLLQDARRDVPAVLEAEMLGRYRGATGAGDAFDAAYAVLGAQRNAKIVGIFTRLWQRDGKPRYAAMCPRVWRYLERDLSHPALAPVAAWFSANIPPALRGDPMDLAGR